MGRLESSDTPDTTVAILTPPGRAAIATVVVEGTQATEMVAAFFRPASERALAEADVGRILFGRWGDEGEELVVARRSPTRVEIHCHGGSAAAKKIVGDLVRHGGRESTWREWIAADEQHAIRAEARRDLAKAVTARTAGILLDQYCGALEQEIESIRGDLAAGDARRANDRLKSLLARSPLGRRLVEPWRVVLAGRPNVGKSSLINALVGFQRAIVYDQPGTTRDAVSAATVVDGWPVELTDTAGLRDPAEPLEAAGLERTQARLATADLVILVFDRSAPWTNDDQDVLQTWPGAIVVHNKCDLPPSAGPRPAGLAVSATRPEGIESLIAELARRLVPAPPQPGDAVPFRPRHVEAIEAAIHSLQLGDQAAADQQLDAIKDG